jgi:bromodomain-containing protein 7
VTDEEAPGYSDIVKNAMDFGTMKEKVANGVYGTGSEAATLLYEDFLLVFDNCNLFNSDDSEVTEEAARILGHLPEAYASACLTVSKRVK